MLSSISNSKPLRIAIVAGELSGDKLGASLIRSLKAAKPSVLIEGVGGDNMAAEGLNLIFHCKKISVMAIVEALICYPKLKYLHRKLICRWKKNLPDIFIGIDAPDFNLKIAYALKKKGVRTVQYVSPKVWAWRSSRITFIKNAVDKILCVFPFEVEFYQKHGIQADFVGHPLADQIPKKIAKTVAKNNLDISKDQKVLCLMPGSRRSELRQHTVLFAQVAKEMCLNYTNLRAIFVLPNVELANYFQQLCPKNLSTDHNIQIVIGSSHPILAACDIALIKSGTSTLEALFFKKPMVVAYRCHPISYWFAKRLLQIPWVSLPNILARNTIVTECIQHEATTDIICGELSKILNPTALEAKKLSASYDTICQSFLKNQQKDIVNCILSL